VVLEPAELFGTVFPLDSETSIGRAAGCQITLDDTYSSQIHARVFARDGAWQVEDLGSTNGTWLNRQKVAGPMIIKPGDHLQIGNTVMELQ
jgi:pSer/pThr/pTyr-binding forkhead associated (FHA) protein